MPRLSLAQLVVILILPIGAAALGLAFDGVASAEPTTSAPRADAARVEAEARTLEKRLLAPCCYLQTLDTHSSELTTSLRHEIRDRLATGESMAAVEQDLIARYGAKIVAVPPSSPLETVALVAFLGVFAAGGVLWWRARRWIQSDVSSAEPGTAAGDQYDAAVDEALDALDR